jgi:hypothetical protein
MVVAVAFAMGFYTIGLLTDIRAELRKIAARNSN